MPATSLVMGSLPDGNTGRGTSLLETVQQLGGVLGVAALGSLIGYGYLARLTTHGLPAPAADAARDSVSGADEVARQLHDTGLAVSADEAFVHGMNLVLTACGIISLLAAVLAAIYLPSRSRASRKVAEAAPEHAESMA